MATKICDLVHPEYSSAFSDWQKWRLTYNSGEAFIRRYLRRITRREDAVDYMERLLVTYCPAFAKAAINDIKNSIFQRLVDITREGGPSSYQAAISGQLGGVDMLGSSMSTFIGREVLPELLPMSRVGVFVDMPPLPGPTIADKGELHPYLYAYHCEDFRSWTKDSGPNRNDYSSILLRDVNYEYDEDTGLPIGEVTEYRHLWLAQDGYVHAKYYDEKGTINLAPTLAYDWEEATGEIILPIRRIPFVLFELTDSLLSDAANYQIALLNLSSADIIQAIKANFPFYTEQYDPRIASPHIRSEASPDAIYYEETFGNSQLVAAPLTVTNSEEIRVGTAAGRRYPIGAERPDFIHPSPEPLRASMELGEKLKAEIRQLVNLAVTNLSPKMASAESKGMDNNSLEAGLSYIGLELETGERKIAEFWAMYEGKKPATITYPENYSLTGQAERHEKAKSLQELMPSVPSLTYQREIAKQIATIMLGPEVAIETLRRIQSEIDTAPVVMGDPKIIALDIQNGLVSTETASKARGYPPGEVAKAAIDHAERLARITIAQSPGGFSGQARGVSDLGTDPNAGRQEKAISMDTTRSATPTDNTRGEGV